MGPSESGVPAGWGVHPDDLLFQDSPDAGHTDCLCSRCGHLITEADAPAVRLVPDTGGEYRYHRRCLQGAVTEEG